MLSSFAVPPRQARTALACLATVILLVLPSTAFARGGSYAVIGGNNADRAQIHAALAASTFDWSLVPALVEIHVVPGIPAQAAPGEIWLDPALLRACVLRLREVHVELRVGVLAEPEQRVQAEHAQLGGDDDTVDLPPPALDAARSERTGQRAAKRPRRTIEAPTIPAART